MFRLSKAKILEQRSELANIPEGKKLINTINAYSYNMALKDSLFAEALNNGDALIPDGGSIVWTCKLIKSVSTPKERCAGWDFFVYEMNKLNTEQKTPVEGRTRPVVLFLGSSENVLSLIRKNAAIEYPNLDIATYSPPFKPEFSDEDSKTMIDVINTTNPDLLWIGMTAPKQEKWTYSHWNEMNIHCHVGTVGAVFDFFAGTVKRAPDWMQDNNLEWFYRLVQQPKRMWRRYLIGNVEYIWNIFKYR